MEFRGLILLLVKDQFDCLHLYKKKSKAVASIEQYKDYINKLEDQLGNALVKSYIVNLDDDIHRYLWCSNVWRPELSDKISPNHQKYINFLTENRKDIKFIGPYKGMSKNGLHLCNRGHEWRTQPIKIKKGEVCLKCQKRLKRVSNGEELVSAILEKNKIEFIREVNMERLGYEYKLRLDFVVCQNKIPLFAIEYNGIQHYKYLRSKYFGGYQGARELRKRDKGKREFCWKIGLPVIDIPYSESEEQVEKTVLFFLELFEINVTKDFDK